MQELKDEIIDLIMECENTSFLQFLWHFLKKNGKK